jgi:hypothetical protein
VFPDINGRGEARERQHRAWEDPFKPAGVYLPGRPSSRTKLGSFVVPDAGVLITLGGGLDFSAAKRHRSSRGMPTESEIGSQRVLSCCHVLDLDSHDPTQGNIQVSLKPASLGGWDAATGPEVY